MKGYAILPTEELKLGDYVMDVDQPENGVQVVKQIENGQTTMFRPYPHTADFSYTGGVICYVGHEEYPAGAQQRWRLIRRQNLGGALRPDGVAGGG